MRRDRQKNGKGGKGKRASGKIKSRARVEIEVWMLRKGLKARDLARDLNVSASAITHFLDGRFQSQRIRDHLIGLGCPEMMVDGLVVEVAA